MMTDNECVMRVMRLFFLLQLFFQSFSESYANETTMFSSRIVGNNNNRLLVVKNNEVFVRKVSNNVFEYEIPENNCYNLKNGVYICTNNGKINAIEGEFYNVANVNKIKTDKYNDEFYREKNISCNAMKFDIINKIFVKKEQIDGFETQLYLPDYYSLIRLVLYRDIDDGQKTKVFIISDKNDVGCSPFRGYKIYKPPVEEHNSKTKTKKKKKIVAKTTRDFLQQVSVESYKTMLLPGYAYLCPTNATSDAKKIVLDIEDCNVDYINAMAIDFEWKKIGFNELFTHGENVDNMTNAKRSNAKKKR